MQLVKAWRRELEGGGGGGRKIRDNNNHIHKAYSFETAHTCTHNLIQYICTVCQTCGQPD